LAEAAAALARLRHNFLKTLYFCVKKTVFLFKNAKSVVYFKVVTERSLTRSPWGGLIVTLNNLLIRLFGIVYFDKN
jgi:hypothetical protein